MANPLGFLVIGGAGGLIIGILIGAALMGGYGFLSSGGTNIPYDQNHIKIANGFKIVDTTWNVQLAPHHQETAPITYSPYAPLDIFTPHQTYTQSLWTYTSGSDIDVLLVILGPSNDGHTYLVSFSRQMGNSASINGFGMSGGWQQGSTESRIEWLIDINAGG